MTTTAFDNRQTTETPPPWEPRWAPSRVIVFALATFLLLGAAGTLTGAAWLDNVEDGHRDGGYLTSDTRELHADGHALKVDELDLDGLSGDWILGKTRVRATSTDPDASVFIGIAEKDDAAEYLDGVGYSTVREVDHPDYVEHDGGSPAVAPADSDIWIAQASGTGTQDLRWTPEEGDWTVVVMNADGTGDVDVKADVGATVPLLGNITTGLYATGGLLALISLGLFGGLFARRKRTIAG
jgi:hypothetical protein